MNDFIYYSNVNGINLLIGNFFYIKKENGVSHSVFKHSLTNGYFITEEFKIRVHEIFSKYINTYEDKEQIIAIRCVFGYGIPFGCKTYKEIYLYDKEIVSIVYLPDIFNIELVTDKPLMYYKLTSAIRYFGDNLDYYSVYDIHRSIFGHVTINNIPLHAFKKYKVDDTKINI